MYEKTKILAANMWPIFYLEEPEKRLKRFLQEKRSLFKLIIESIVLYDEIIIPTQDFLSLSALIQILGEKAVLDLLEIGCLKFVRMKGSIGYTGPNIGEGGIQAFEEKPTLNIELPRASSIALLSPSEDAIDWSLSSSLVGPLDNSRLLFQTVKKATKDRPLTSVFKGISENIYKDIISNPELKKLFPSKGFEFNLTKLPGLNPNEVRIYNEQKTIWEGDMIDKALLLALASVELRLAKLETCLDISTSNLTSYILDLNIKRVTRRSNASTAFTSLLELNRMPDVGECVLEDKTIIDGLINLRESRDGQQFRGWFHSKCSTNPEEIERDYVMLLKKVSSIQTLPIRVLRFIVVTAIGSWDPTLGSVLSAADSFFIENWLKGCSPKFFIQKLEKILD